MSSEQVAQQAASIEQPGSPDVNAGSNGHVDSAPVGDSGVGEKKAFDSGYGRGLEKAEKKFAARVEKLKQQWLAEMGLESPEDVEAFKARAEEADKTLPEWQRKFKSLEKQTSQMQAELEQHRKANAEWGERWFTENRRRMAASIAHRLNMFDWARDDLDGYLERKVVTVGDDDDARLILRDGDSELEFDADNEKALEQLADHVAKRRPGWIKPSMAGPQTAVGLSPMPPDSPQKPLTKQQAKEQFLRQTIQSMRGPRG
jgi:hypothetical protein